MPRIKIGYGYDAHRLTEGRRLVLGGIEIPHSTGLLGHSDADVLVHAICDALLGALCLGDIGKLFPDQDASYEGIDSCILLEKVVELVKSKGYTVSNIDTCIRAQKPKLAPYIPQMQAKLAAILETDSDCVSIKASTTEKMGFEGREEGISSSAVVLLCAD